MLQEIYSKPEYKAKVYDPENQERLKAIFKTRLGRWFKQDKGKIKIKKLSKTLEERIAYWEGKIDECNKTKTDLARKASRLERLILSLFIFCTCTLLGKKSSLKKKRQENLDAIEEALPNIENLKLCLKNLSLALQSALPATFWAAYDDEEYSSKLSENADEEKGNTLDDMLREIKNYIGIRATRESRKSLEEELKELFRGVLPDDQSEKSQTTEAIEANKVIAAAENSIESEEYKTETEENQTTDEEETEALELIANEENPIETEEYKAAIEANQEEKAANGEEIEAPKSITTEESPIETEEYKAVIEANQGEKSQTTEEIEATKVIAAAENPIETEEHQAVIEANQEEKAANEEETEALKSIANEENAIATEENPKAGAEENQELPKVEMIETLDEIKNIQQKVNEEAHRVLEPIAGANGKLQVSGTLPNLNTANKNNTPLTLDPAIKTQRSVLFSGIDPGEKPINAFTAPANGEEKRSTKMASPITKQPKVVTNTGAKAQTDNPTKDLNSTAINEEKSEEGHHHHHHHDHNEPCECCRKKNIPEANNTFITKKASVRRR